MRKTPSRFTLVTDGAGRDVWETTWAPMHFQCELRIRCGPPLLRFERPESDCRWPQPSCTRAWKIETTSGQQRRMPTPTTPKSFPRNLPTCLLYTSDAADERS